MSGVQFNAMEPDIAARTKEAKYEEAVPKVKYDKAVPEAKYDEAVPEVEYDEVIPKAIQLLLRWSD